MDKSFCPFHAACQSQPFNHNDGTKKDTDWVEFVPTGLVLANSRLFGVIGHRREQQRNSEYGGVKFYTTTLTLFCAKGDKVDSNEKMVNQMFVSFVSVQMNDRHFTPS